MSKINKNFFKREKINNLINKGIINKNGKNENLMSIKANNEISQINSARLIRKNNNSNKLLVMNNSNPKINDIS